ncbi:gluconokinase [Flavilitoribacter nigricans]|uniref:Gluconate kinase n=1 Tax=Flavilitoribacter nigricans (strain ATCC 23147 / DSM 23189 / NBRC 102662 / NCIMB 1420 / SS-2) TaxID=1122177 RepID=A0A2D0N199_FLAN2|nr:gluconokinase [Flavilitoribacter nigricans]PHN02311.1 gluconate kinase [Flavilitoribacter nigricans DSM 23189 = NBRC 102662]
MQTASELYFIGLDIGTSSAKAVAFRTDGTIVDQSSAAYDLQQPEPDAAVQDADTVLQATLDSLRQLRKKLDREPAAIGLSSAMHSLLAIDRSGRPVSKLITWADGRARPYAEQLRGTETGKFIYRHSGTPIHAMTPLCKLAWMRRQHPDIFSRAEYFVGIKDYLLHHCFGQWLIDHSLASATGLFDLRRRQWIPEALEYTQIKADRLPEAVPVHRVLQDLRKTVAEDLGLAPDTPWVIGASDGCLANLGAGILDGQEAVLTIGTSGAIRMTVNEAVYDPEERLFCYILDEERYVIGGPTNNGGVVWEWFCEQFYPEQPMDGVFDRVSRVPPGAEGLLFLPYLYGERAPVWDASAKGHFWGIEAHHSRDHFARAVLEGICLNLFQITEALETVGGTIERIHANGGFTQSPVWVQILADVMGKEIVIGASPQASAWGAAIMAMESTGHTAAPKAQTRNEVFAPDADRHRVYRELFKQFKGIYPSAKVS